MDKQKIVEAIDSRLRILRDDMRKDDKIQGDPKNSFALRNVAFARWNCRTNEEKFLMELLSAIETI